VFVKNRVAPSATSVDQVDIQINPEFIVLRGDVE